MKQKIPNYIKALCLSSWACFIAGLVFKDDALSIIGCVVASNITIGIWIVESIGRGDSDANTWQ